MKVILSIRGGGIRGVIPAMVCEEIENRTGKPIWELFDLVVGTSTGGILACGLTVAPPGKSFPRDAGQMANLYIKEGERIFSERQKVLGITSFGITEEKWRHEPLEAVLREYFGRQTLLQSFTRTLVSSYDVWGRRLILFKDWKPEYGVLPITKICRATSAAPTYFEPLELKVGGVSCCLVDGGIKVNNPSGVALTEARKLWPDDFYTVVDLGTGICQKRYRCRKAKDWGALEWLPALLEIFMDGEEARYRLEHNPDVDDWAFDTELKHGNEEMDDGSHGNVLALAKDAQRMIEQESQRLDELCELLRNE